MLCNPVVRVKLTSRLDFLYTQPYSPSRLVAGSFDIYEVMSLVFSIYIYIFVTYSLTPKNFSVSTDTRLFVCLESETLEGKNSPIFRFILFLANTDLLGFLPSACVWLQLDSD